MNFIELHPDWGMIDSVLVVIANIINLLVTGIFISRTHRKSALEHSLGLFMILLTIPIGAIVLHNALTGREWWTVVLPGIMILYLSLEFVLDYVLKIEFRKTVLLWPYLVVFYAALMGLIGFAFLTSRWRGYVTLGTYFLSLVATWHSYSKVGHGQSMKNGGLGDRSA